MRSASRLLFTGARGDAASFRHMFRKLVWIENPSRVIGEYWRGGAFRHRSGAPRLPLISEIAPSAPFSAAALIDKPEEVIEPL